MKDLKEILADVLVKHECEFLTKEEILEELQESEDNEEWVKFALEAMELAVNNILEEAAEKAQMIVYDGHNKTNSYSKHIQMGVNNAQIDKESILNLQVK